MSKNQVGKTKLGVVKMYNIRKETKEIRNRRTRNSILINPNILADTLCDLIKAKSDKNYVICYGKNFIYLLEEINLNKMYFIHNVDDVIDNDGILIYKNRVNICNTGEFGYIREFIKYLIEFNLEYADINQILEGFIERDNKSKTRILKHNII